MWKTHKRTILLTLFLTLLPIVVGLFLWNQLPEQVATHFSSNEPDGWSSRAFAVFVLPAICAGCHLLCAVAPALDPKHENITPKVMTIILWIMPLISWFTSGMILSYAMGKQIPVQTAVGLLIGFVFLILGNYLPKTKQNYTVGIKVPWALNNEENWYHTHRFAGFLFTVAGLIIIVAGLLNWVVILIAVAVLAAIAPCIYSYHYYRRHGE